MKYLIRTVQKQEAASMFAAKHFDIPGAVNMHLSSLLWDINTRWNNRMQTL